MPVGPNAPYTSLDQNQILQRAFEESNDRLRVDAQVSVTLGTVACEISAASGDNIAITSQDGTKTLAINSDGSINVSTSEQINYQYNELFVGPGITSSIVSFTGTKIKLMGILISGTNMATYEVIKNGVNTISKLHTSLTNFNAEFNLNGIIINATDTISVEVYNSRTTGGDFNATIKYVVV